MKYGPLIRTASKKLWRELGEQALKSAVDTLVEEGVEAAVEIWKKKRLKIQEEVLDQRDFSDEKMDSEQDETAEASAESTNIDPIDPEGSDSGSNRYSIEELGAYADRKSSD